MEPNKARYARKTAARTLADVMPGADIFLGLSSGRRAEQPRHGQEDGGQAADPGAGQPDARDPCRRRPRRCGPTAIIATGRSDYPNQVNNVLCFPFIFRGALDVGATRITDEMKLACVKAIAELAQAEQSDVVAMAYEGEELKFGPDYIIPKPFDPRLIIKIAPAVAEGGHGQRRGHAPDRRPRSLSPSRLTQFVHHSGLIMKPVFALAKQQPRRVIYRGGRGRARAARGAGRGRTRSWPSRS